MEVMCKVVIVVYLVGGEHGGGRGSEVKGRGKKGRKGEERRKE
jgi:hypothetical protein